MRGAFEFQPADGHSAVSATVESKGRVLKGDAAVTMKRASTDPTCMSGAADVQSACIVWNHVFDVCDLLAEVGMPTLVTDFTVEIGDWSVSNSSERQFISFGFEIAASVSPPSSRPLSAFLELSRPCANVAECRSNVPTVATPEGGLSFLMTDARIHLRGKKGVTSQAECHGDTDSLAASGGSTLVITAPARLPEIRRGTRADPY